MHHGSIECVCSSLDEELDCGRRAGVSSQQLNPKSKQQTHRSALKTTSEPIRSDTHSPVLVSANACIYCIFVAKNMLLGSGKWAQRPCCLLLLAVKKMFYALAECWLRTVHIIACLKSGAGNK
jgi:hypothetical protein